MSTLIQMLLDTVNRTDMSKVLIEFPNEDMHTLLDYRERVVHRIVIMPTRNRINENQVAVMFLIYVNGKQFVYQAICDQRMTIRECMLQIMHFTREFLHKEVTGVKPTAK